MGIIIKIWKLLPAIIGIAQAVLPLIKEIIVSVVRIIDIITPGNTIGEKIISKVNLIYDKIYGYVESVKNFMLG